MNLHNNPYDIYEPAAGHKERFQRKLTSRLPAKRRFFVKPEWIAASVLILLGLFILSGNYRQTLLGKFIPAEKIYPQMMEKQEEWANFLKEQVLEWERFETPEAKRLITETYTQLNRLDKDYQKLNKEFQQTGNRYVLEAMIENTEQRRELLEEFQKKLIQIEKMKRYEKQKHNI